jgi:hypothetical protein
MRLSAPGGVNTTDHGFFAQRNIYRLDGAKALPNVVSGLFSRMSAPLA